MYQNRADKVTIGDYYAFAKIPDRGPPPADALIIGEDENSFYILMSREHYYVSTVSKKTNFGLFYSKITQMNYQAGDYFISPTGQKHIILGINSHQRYVFLTGTNNWINYGFIDDEGHGRFIRAITPSRAKK